jgi:hypothetical protein
VVCKFGQREKGSYARNYTQNDTDSQSNYALPGSSERIFSRVVKSNWNEELAALTEEISDSATTMVMRGGFHGFTGFHTSYPAASQPAWAKVGASKPSYYLIEDEIIKCTAITPNDSYRGLYHTQDLDDGTYSQEGPHHVLATFSGLTRGALGTTAASHVGIDPETRGIGNPIPAVYDITILVEMANTLIDRFGDGLSIVTVKTTFAEYDKQLGDLVTLEWDKYLEFGKDGLTGSQKWEIIGKEIVLFGDKPHIKWTLASAGTASATKTHAIIDNATLGEKASFRNHMQNKDIAVNHVVTGLVPSQTTGLTARVTPGLGAGLGVSSEVTANIDHALDASSDVYITMDLLSRAIIYSHVANGATPPGWDDQETLIGKLITDGSGITTEDTTQVIDGAVGVQQINTVYGIAINMVPNGSFTASGRG